MRRASPISSTRNNRSPVIERPCHPCRVAGFFAERTPNAGPSCGSPWRRSYSQHDPQKCGIAGFDRNNPDDGSSRVGFCLHRPQCPPGSNSCGHAVPLIHLCVRLLQCNGVLFRVPPGAVVVIVALEPRKEDKPLCAVFLAQRELASRRSGLKIGKHGRLKL